MTTEAFEKAKKIEQRISHISKVIDFIKEHGQPDGNITNIFITNEAEDYIDLEGDEVEYIIDALESKMRVLHKEFIAL